MIDLDAPTVFVQWATGMLVWLVVADRRERVPFGYTWPVRTFVIVLGVLSLSAVSFTELHWPRDGATLLVVVITTVAVFSSLTAAIGAKGARRSVAERDRHLDDRSRSLDLVAAGAGLCATIAATVHAGGPLGLAIARVCIGALFLGGLTTAMVFGHRHLAKRELSRSPLHFTTTWLLVVWPFEVLVMVIPTGMVSVLSGTIDDGYGGILGWMWAMCALATGALVVMARVILRDRQASVVAAAPGMMYLAALMGFAANLVARAVLTA